MSRHILTEIEYLIAHRNDYLSDRAVVENIAKALNGQRFSPPTVEELSDYRMNTKVPQHLYDDQVAALKVALGSDSELSDVMSKIHEVAAVALKVALGVDSELSEVAAVARKPVGGYWSLNNGAHVSLKATLRAFGPAALGIVLRFHIEAGTSFSGPSKITVATKPVATKRLSDLGLTPADLRWPQSIWSHYFEDAAPEDPELDARIAAGIEAWKTALINKTI